MHSEMEPSLCIRSRTFNTRISSSFHYYFAWKLEKRNKEYSIHSFIYLRSRKLSSSSKQSLEEDSFIAFSPLFFSFFLSFHFSPILLFQFENNYFLQFSLIFRNSSTRNSSFPRFSSRFIGYFRNTRGGKFRREG